jgi:nucleoporin NDC1
VINVLEKFVSEGLGVHWTDVDYQSDPDARKVEEVEIVLAALKGGLAELLGEFRLYLSEVGLVGKDLRLAREAAGISGTSASATTS